MHSPKDDFRLKRSNEDDNPPTTPHRLIHPLPKPRHVHIPLRMGQPRRFAMFPSEMGPHLRHVNFSLLLSSLFSLFTIVVIIVHGPRDRHLNMRVFSVSRKGVRERLAPGFEAGLDGAVDFEAVVHLVGVDLPAAASVPAVIIDAKR